MPWERVPDLSQREVSEFFKEHGKKARFLVDENIDPELAPVLRRERWNVVSVGEVGPVGHADEDVFNHAWRDNRILLTKDRDFLNNQRFPPHRNPGVIVLPDEPEDSRAFFGAMLIALTVMGRLREVYRYSKIEIDRTGVMVIESRNLKTGRYERRRVRDTDRDVEEWVEGQ